MTDIRTFDDRQSLAQGAAGFIAGLAEHALSARGRFSVALAGGSTPRDTYALLAQPPLLDRIDWSRTLIFFGDERAVPPDHEDSNYRMAHEVLLSRVPLPEENIQRMHAERNDLDAAAREYEAALRSLLGPPAGAPPRLDLVLLGIGPDGHTASIFPGTENQTRGPQLVTRIQRPQTREFRLTLTLPILNAASNVAFLISGASKASIVRSVLSGQRGADLLPASRIMPESGQLTYLLDQAAASSLA